MRVLVVFMVVLLLAGLVEATNYQTTGCHFGCKWAGFVCCTPASGLYNHYARYDAPDKSGECWAECGTPAVQAQELLPDFTVRTIEARGYKGYWYLTALLENIGEGTFENKDKNRDNHKLKIEQRLDRYPFLTTNRERIYNSWYRVKTYGPLPPGAKKWTTEFGIPTPDLVLGASYEYTIRVNPVRQYGVNPESNLQNNIFKARITLNKDGTLTITRLV